MHDGEALCRLKMQKILYYLFMDSHEVGVARS